MKGRGFGIGILAIIAAFGAAVMLLWNAVLPDIIGVASINFWQALGLLALSRILFGGLAGIINHLHRHHNPIQEKWKNMTFEQRREFIKRRNRFGFGRFHFDLHKDDNQKDNDQ